MITGKHIDRIVWIITAIAVAAVFLAIGFRDTLASAAGDDAGVTMEYESRLFDTDEVISIDIQIDQEEWEDMLENATAEEYKSCDVVVNGTAFKNVAIRPKGNTSLTSIASDPDNNRYSFKLEFDHYDGSQTCWGLDKLILNNNFADATNMKEAAAYDMFHYLGADSSLYNYAKISVNGEYWGVYLALEGVEDSFLLRNYGTQRGQLYKPDSMNMAAADDSDSESDAGAPGGFGSFMNSGGADLSYTDDDLDSYSTIWDGAVTDSGEKDHERVVTALKNISEGHDLEKYMDVDNILRYMAVHSFVVNEDSFTGAMNHNYYLYEHDGQLNIIPWDYNLSFGGMGMNGDDASAVINDPIDTPFQSTDFFDGLLENEEYLEKYHTYYRQLVEGYVDGGEFEKTYDRIRSQIDELVKTDPNAMYTYDEYEKAAETLVETIQLRARSVEGQLDGTIPSTDAGQRSDSSALIDTGDLDLSVMGTFSRGGFSASFFETDSGSDDDSSENAFAGGPPQNAGSSAPAGIAQTGGTGSAATETEPESEMMSGDEEAGSSGMPSGFDPSNIPDNVDTSNMPSGSPPSGTQGGSDMANTPSGFESSNMPDDVDTSNMPDPPSGADGFGPSPGESREEAPAEASTEYRSEGTSESAAEEASGEASTETQVQAPSFPGGSGASFPGNFSFEGFGETEPEEDTTVQDNLKMYLILLGITAAAIIAAVVYPRRKK